MKIYFLSSQPCALFVAGAYFGRTGDFERYAELSLKDGLPVQFVPEGAHPLACFLKETLPVQPPDGTEVYLLPDGIALRACRFAPVDLTLVPIAQQRSGNALVTVYRQGAVQVSLETSYGFFNAYLPPSFQECTIQMLGEFVLLKSPTELAVFHQNGNKLLCEQCLDHTVEEGENGVVLRAHLPLSDRFRRTATCQYLLTPDSALRTEYILKQAEGSIEDTNGLIAYAFFESVRIGAEIHPFLCEELLPKSQLLTDFLGKFLYVLPTDDPCVCRLVYQKAERVFDVRPYTVRLQNGKIADIQG